MIVFCYRDVMLIIALCTRRKSSAVSRAAQYTQCGGTEAQSLQGVARAPKQNQKYVYSSSKGKGEEQPQVKSCGVCNQSLMLVFQQYLILSYLMASLQTSTLAPSLSHYWRVTVANVSPGQIYRLSTSHVTEPTTDFSCFSRTIILRLPELSLQ